jgi:hypothetical protein
MMVNARMIQVIETDLTRRGDGTTDDPVRLIKQYWTLDGELLAEVDHWAAQYGSHTAAMRRDGEG